MRMFGTHIHGYMMALGHLDTLGCLLMMIDGGLESLKLLYMAPWVLNPHTYNLLMRIYGSSCVQLNVDRDMDMR